MLNIKRIVILGAGFAAITAAKKLAKLTQKKNVIINLVAPNDKFTYYPSLIWIPYGMRTKDQLEFSLDDKLARLGIYFYKGAVINVDADKVYTNNGDLEYDYLIIATGAQYIKKAKGITENVLIPCEGIASSEKIKQKLADLKQGTISFGFSGNPNEPSAMRGGPLFEFTFGIDSWLRKQGIRDKFTLNFVSPASKPGQRLGKKAVNRLLNEMKKRDINTYLGAKIVEFGKDHIRTETENINSDLTLFIPGMTGPDWLKNSNLPLSSGGFVVANEKTEVRGFSNIFVAGDSGSFPGPDWFPKQAHMADMQAQVAAKNIYAKLNNKPAIHKFRIELICIIDTLNSGVMVFRNLKFAFMLKSPIFHWLKIIFEKLYLRKFR